MTERRSVFIDFDGTFASRGVAPAAHVEAVRAARRRGHAVFLCTGRPVSIVAQDVAALFDGAVTSAGAHVRVGEEVLRDDRFPGSIARRTVRLLQSRQVPFTLEAPEALYCTPVTAERMRARVPVPRPEGGAGNGPQDIIAAITTPEDLLSPSFAKISIWGSPVPVEQLASEIGDEVGALPNSIAQDDTSSGELHLRAIDKADGVLQVVSHLGMTMQGAIGIGDGMNDLGMLRAAGTAVVVEGAPAPVLAEADLVIPGPDRHGITTAFERLGLI